MRDKFEKLFNDYEKLIELAEKNIVSEFKEVLLAAYELLGEQFRKYEEDGILTYGEMIKYKRLDKFSHELDLIINDGYKNSYKGIKKALSDTYITSYNGVKDIVELEINKKLIPIVKDEMIQRALTNDISGLKWTERMNLHRDTAVLRIRETVAQGLHRGETYSTMSKRLNDSLSKQVVNPLRIVRTESHRVFSEARKDSLDKAKNKVKMTKTWITARDEKVRGRNPKDTMDHVSMDGITIPYEDDFELPDGAKGFAPGQIGDYNDINCRCDWIIDFIDETLDNNEPNYVDIPDNNKGNSEVNNNYNRVNLESIMSDVNEHISNAPEDIKGLFNDYLTLDNIKIDQGFTKPFAYSESENIIKINPYHELYKYYDKDRGIIHELFHMIDMNEGLSTSNIDYIKALEIASVKVKSNISEYSTLVDEDGVFEYNMSISDIFDALSDGEVHGAYSHKLEYWEVMGNKEKEIFADIGVEYVFGGDAIEFIKNEFEELYNSFVKLIGGI